jgi:hypothetical protein
MTDQNQNVCPYCGGKIRVDGGDIWEACRAQCCYCGACGPVKKTVLAAIHTFTHPAHLLKDKCLVNIADAETVAGAVTKGLYLKTDVLPAAYRIHAAVTAAKGE